MIIMTWKNTIKKDYNLNFADNEKDWMERDAETAFDFERHKTGVIQSIIGAGGGNSSSGLLGDLEERIATENESAHINVDFGKIDFKSVEQLLMPIIKELVERYFEFDMDKFEYSGP